MVHALILFLGVITGLAIALALATAWVAFAGAAQERLTELLFDPRFRPESTSPAQDAGEVLVSDLHIDTWNYPQSATAGRAKSFREFLATVRAEDKIQGFILNGDLMDIPLFAGTTTQTEDPLLLPVPAGQITERGVLVSRYDAVLTDLLNLEKPEPPAAGCVRRAIFQTGNHDIGVCGMRYAREQVSGYLPPIKVTWNPQIVLEGGPKDGEPYANPIYIEHGHHYDPFLWLYMRYALLDILRGGHQGDESNLVAGIQRQGRTGMGRSARGTDWGSVRGQQATGLAQTTLASVEQAAAAPPPIGSPQDWDFAGQKLSLLERIVVYRYRQAARRVFRDLRRQKRSEIRTVILGHTHIPDRYVFPGGYVYVNSGDWCGHTSHQCYCVIHGDGTVRGPFQWQDEARFLQTLNP